jgi:hypothetical protein
LSSADAAALLERLRARAAFASVRGARPADVPALLDLLVKLSRLAVEQATLDTLELNPVIVHPLGQGISIVDALLLTRLSL